ncbi:MAG: hypothetical protein GY762_17150 [Proteobacteria bacterium]|nr:hypothetical protein [Pseudomonadota bacterium]
MKKSGKNLIILFVTIAVVMLGFGIIIPIIPFLIKRFGGGGAGPRTINLDLLDYAVPFRANLGSTF